jgi:macrolide transport system ATP-binding/permease protein
MNWKRLINRLKGTPQTHEDHLDEELSFHRDMKVRELMREGMTRAEAETETQRRMGNLTRVREDAREAWTFEWVRDAIRDVRYGLRNLAAQPGFTITALLALVLGIGANATVFSLFNVLTWAPWDVRDPGQVAQVLLDRGKGNWSGVSWPLYRHFRSNLRSGSGIAAYTSTGVRVTSGQVTWEGMAVTTSDNFFDLLGLGFAVGRGFSPEPNFSNPVPEIVLQYDTWMARFGGDRDIVGKWIDLNGHQLQVVGVAAEGFVGPSPNRPELWITGPWRDVFQPGLNTINNHDNCCVSLLARLLPGVTYQQAQAELNTLTAQFEASPERTGEKRDYGVMVVRPSLMANPKMRTKATVAFLAVGVASLLVLLLACANVANLQLARTLARKREIAVRLSLGASRFRILRQLLAESVLLSVAAGASTLAITAYLPGVLLNAIAGSTEQLTFVFRNDIRVLAFVLALSVSTAMLLGLLPAMSAIREAVASGLSEGGRATSTGRLRSVLLGAQVTLCAVLLCGTMLLVRALDKAQRMEPGFRYDDVVALSTSLGSSGASDEQARGPLHTLMERVSGIPGVHSVAHTSIVPLGNSFDVTSVPDPRSASRRIPFVVSQVSANYFDVLRIPVIAGRTFAATDEINADSVIVSEELARQLWPDQNPIGKSMAAFGKTPVVVVGVARNILSRELSPVPELHAYLPRRGNRHSYVLIRHNDPAAAATLLASLPKLGREVDRRLFPKAERLEGFVDRARRSARLSASIASCLSLLSLLIACIGIYGVASYAVSQRVREIGIRMTMGATAGGILRMVVGQNLRIVVIGAVLGTAGALALGSILKSLLYGLEPTDPFSLAVAMAILLATALISALAPARRAAAVDPAITLRHD